MKEAVQPVNKKMPENYVIFRVEQIKLSGIAGQSIAIFDKVNLLPRKTTHLKESVRSRVAPKTLFVKYGQPYITPRGDYYSTR